MLAPALLAIALCAAPATPHSADEQDIKKVVSAFRAAVETQNGVELKGLFWPDALVFENGVVSRSADEFIHERMEPLFKELAFKWVDEENSGRADVPLAYVAHLATIEVREGAGPARRAVNALTFVLRKRDQVWKISHLQWSSGKSKPVGISPPPRK